MSALQSGDASADLACPTTHSDNLKDGVQSTLFRSPLKLEKQISIGSTAAPNTPCGSLPGTPMTGMPMSSPTLKFLRCLSGASTAPPEHLEDHFEDVDGEESHLGGSPIFSRCLSPDSWFSASPIISRNVTPEGPLPPLYLPPQFPHFEPHFNAVPEEAEDKEEEETTLVSDEDGTKWTVTRGLPPTWCSIEAKLDAVKALYLEKYGKDVDEESDLGGQDEQIVYEDGVKGILVRGAPPTLESLERKLSDVKELYCQKYGYQRENSEEAEDEEEIVYQDGVKGIIIRGAAPSLSSLELKLAVVKGLYESKYGETVDSDLEEAEDEEEIVYQDGVKGIMIRGTAPSLSFLELKLAEVKGLYESKYGETVDSDLEEAEDEEEIVYQDGVKGIIIRGAAPSLSSLELKLAEVKGLYEQKFGGVAIESDEEVEIVYEDGVKGVMVRGSAPSVSELETKLVEVKALHKQKFGKGVDEDSNGEAEIDAIVVREDSDKDLTPFASCMIL